jgi:DNA-binding GntR family transcriptional regulator
VPDNEPSGDSRPESVVEFTIQTLREAIRDGRFAPGQRLVVSDVTRRLGVSAGPVREAIRRLTGEGLVEIRPHRGALVKEYTAKELADIFNLREVVEGLAARLAACRIQVGDYRDRMTQLLEEMRQETETMRGDYVDQNHTFHLLIYEMAGSDRIAEIAASLVLPIYSLRFHQRMSQAYSKVSYGEHAAIAEAILKGHGHGAERAMRRHIRNSGEAMTRALREAPQVRPANA